LESDKEVVFEAIKNRPASLKVTVKAWYLSGCKKNELELIYW